MSFKNTLKTHFSEEGRKELLAEREKASLGFFILSALAFFLSYFFVATQFYFDFFSSLLPFSYICFLACFYFFLYFLLKKMYIDKSKSIFYIAILIITGVFGFFIIAPIL